jgi:excisionase family DNA binding protein
MSTGDILTIQEIALELRCSKAHVYKVIAGKVAGVSPLPALSIGRRRLVRRGTLDQWKTDNETCATIAPLAIDTVGA